MQSQQATQQGKTNLNLWLFNLFFFKATAMNNTIQGGPDIDIFARECAPFGPWTVWAQGSMPWGQWLATGLEATKPEASY